MEQRRSTQEEQTTNASTAVRLAVEKSVKNERRINCKDAKNGGKRRIGIAVTTDGHTLLVVSLILADAAAITARDNSFQQSILLEGLAAVCFLFRLCTETAAAAPFFSFATR